MRKVGKNRLLKSIVAVLLIGFQLVLPSKNIKAVENNGDNNSAECIEKAMEYISKEKNEAGYWKSEQYVNDTCDALELFNEIMPEKDLSTSFQ